MGIGRRNTIGGTLTLLGLAVALTLRTWLVMESEPRLGPRNGLDLPGIDTGRVAMGDVAPDFSLMTYTGTVTTLSDYRGEKSVVLVFYRGYW